MVGKEARPYGIEIQGPIFQYISKPDVAIVEVLVKGPLVTVERGRKEYSAFFGNIMFKDLIMSPFLNQNSVLCARNHSGL